MGNNIEINSVEMLKESVSNEQNLITERYNFLLNEQPQLKTIEPQRLTSSITGGCFSSLLPIYFDFKEPFQDVEIGYFYHSIVSHWANF